MSVFQEAYGLVGNVEKIVGNRIDQAVESAIVFQEQAAQTIDDLADFKTGFVTQAMPAAPVINLTLDGEFELPDVEPKDFGEINVQELEVPDLYEPDAPDKIDLPDFNPTLTGFSIPEAPQANAPTAPPEAPTITYPTVPDAPGITAIEVPTFVELTIPGPPTVVLPTLDLEEPEFVGTAVASVMAFNNEKFEDTYLAEMADQMATWRNIPGMSLGLPEETERALAQRAYDREGVIVGRELSGVDEEFSQRGFTMPPGMELARLDQLRQDFVAKVLEASREVYIKAMDISIENMRFAVQQGLAIEATKLEAFNTWQARALEVAKGNIESQIALYNAQVGLFNARMSILQARVAAYEANIRAELGKVEIYKATVDGEIAKGQLNTQKAQVYASMVEASKNQIDVYTARIRGIEVMAGIEKTKVEGFRAQVEAYAQTVIADKEKFSAYTARVGGEVAKASIMESESRAYASLVTAKLGQADLQARHEALNVQNNATKLQAFQGKVEMERLRVTSKLSEIQAAIGAYTADTQRYVAQAGAEGQRAQLGISTQQTKAQIGIAFYQAQISAYTARMEQMLREVAIVLDGLKAAGQLSTTMAAGITAGIHVQASLSGSGGVQASGQSSMSETDNRNVSTTTSYNHNYEGV